MHSQTNKGRGSLILEILTPTHFQIKVGRFLFFEKFVMYKPSHYQSKTINAQIRFSIWLHKWSPITKQIVPNEQLHYFGFGVL